MFVGGSESPQHSGANGDLVDRAGERVRATNREARGEERTHFASDRIA